MKNLKEAKLSIGIPRPKTMGVKHIVVGKYEISKLEYADGWLHIHFPDSVYLIPQAQIEWCKDERPEARQKDSKEGSGGSKKKSPAKKRTGRGRASVRTTGKVRRKSKKAEGSKLQPSSG